MIEELTDSKVTWSHETSRKMIWIFFILSFCFGLLLQLGGLFLLRRDSGGTYLWWGGITIIDTISGIVYYLLTPTALITLSVYLVLIRREIGNIAIVTCLSALISGITWTIHFILHRMAYDLLDVAYAIMYWSTAMIFLGITFFLIGIIYLRKGPITLTRLTGISFLVVGFIGVVVGYIGGFTLLPWFTIYDFPWVTTVAIVPSVLALVLATKKNMLYTEDRSL